MTDEPAAAQPQEQPEGSGGFAPPGADLGTPAAGPPPPPPPPPGGWAPQPGAWAAPPPPGGAPAAGYPPPYPGAPGYPAAAYSGELKSKIAAGLLGIFLGGFGIHRFYLGYTSIGVIQIVVTIVTCGLGSLWGFIEGILILTGSIDRDAEGRPLRD